jgi:hypothetical protein
MIVVKVFNAHVVASPKWADVQPIFSEYARLYPFMKTQADLGDLANVKAKLAAIKKTMEFDETHPGYMPVTRDLSRDKKKVILDWINAGAP